ncbi:hypothetical protein ACVNP1_00705 [Staphylococcus aureus]
MSKTLLMQRMTRVHYNSYATYNSFYSNEVKQIVDVTSVAENDAQLVIKLNGNVDEVYQQLQRLIKNANVEESENTDNINSQDTSYTPQ